MRLKSIFQTSVFIYLRSRKFVRMVGASAIASALAVSFVNCTGGFSSSSLLSSGSKLTAIRAADSAVASVLSCPIGFSYQNGLCLPPASGGDFSSRVGIGYSLLHCPYSPGRGYPTYDNTQILAGNGGFGGVGSVDWWGQPALGYYCLTDRPDVLRQHAIELRDAGVEYIVIDVTNWTDSVGGPDPVDMIEQPLQALLQSWSQIPGAPRVVPWVPVVSSASAPNPMAEWVMNAIAQYPSMQFIEEGKPFFLVTGNPSMPVDQGHLSQLAQNYSYRTMWVPNGNAQTWAYDDICHTSTDGSCNQFIATDTSGNPEQIAVASAVNRYLMSVPGQSTPKNGGQTFINQFATLYNHPSTHFAIINQWNEWVAIHMCYDTNGNATGDSTQCRSASQPVFVDEYTENYSRDLEPNTASGDLYYRQMKGCVANFRRGQSCNLGTADGVSSILGAMSTSLSDAATRACSYPSETNQPAAQNGQVIGNVDGLTVNGSSVILSGWACVVGYNAPINVALYAGGPAGAGVAIGNYSTSVVNESAVDSACQTGGTTHRFQIDVTALMNTNPGQRIYVHGLNPINSVNYFIGQSGHCAIPWPETMAGTGLSTTVSAGSPSSSAIWGLDTDGLIVQYNGQGGWNSIIGWLTQISVGFDGAVWGVNGNGQIFKGDGQSGWTNTPGVLSSISVGNANAVWGLNQAGQIYTYVNGSWLNVPGWLSQLSVGADGAVWGVNGLGQTYQYNGQGGWNYIPGFLSIIKVNNAGDVWGLNSTGSVYRFNGSSWMQLQGSLSQIY